MKKLKKIKKSSKKVEKFKKIKKSSKKLNKIKKKKKVFQKIKKAPKFAWYVGFVIGRGGAKAVRKMKEFFPHIECWIPTVRKQIVERKKIVIKQVAIYDNYVLMKLPCGDVALQQEIIRRTPILYFVKDCESSNSLSVDEITHLSILEKYIVLPLQHNVAVGDTIEVTKGAYKGFLGKVTGVTKGIVKADLDIHGSNLKATLGLNEVKLFGSVGEIKIHPEEGDYNVKEIAKIQSKTKRG